MFMLEIYKLIDEFEIYISEKYPDESWKFIFYNQDRKSLIFYVTTEKYSSLMYVFGHRFLLLLLEFFEMKEMYEECEEIKKQILSHNELLNDNISTFLS